MTREEAKKCLTGISWKLGTMSVEYLTEKDGEKCVSAIKALEKEPCDYCQQGKPLVIGKTDDYGISINRISHAGYNLVAYGYDVHGTNTNGLVTKIIFCPICGRKFD